MSKEESWIISIGKLHTTIYNQDQKIADLEAKLAESEEYNKMLLEEKGGYIDLVSGYSKKCKNYEQQLAEKNKEIEKSHLILDKILTEIHTNCYSGLNIVHFKEMALNDLGGLAITHNQDKISFAVEQLEKVKVSMRELIKCGLENRNKDLDEIEEDIANQIKQLKEMM